MTSSRWDDLLPRVITGVLLAVIGIWSVINGAPLLTILCAVAAAEMVWELARLLYRSHGPASTGMTPLGKALVFAAYGALILAGIGGLFALRQQAGLTVVLWLIGVVIASDVAGYFAGRMLGGPKFWPRVSPKKTWSGTAAGWIAAALVGLLVLRPDTGHLGIALLSALFAFAGQMGDIAESAIKRAVDVKDASNILPGHGGVMDRFDAMIAVFALAFLLMGLGLLPGTV